MCVEAKEAKGSMSMGRGVCIGPKKCLDILINVGLPWIDENMKRTLCNRPHVQGDPEPVQGQQVLSNPDPVPLPTLNPMFSILLCVLESNAWSSSPQLLGLPEHPHGAGVGHHVQGVHQEDLQVHEAQGGGLDGGRSLKL